MVIITITIITLILVNRAYVTPLLRPTLNDEHRNKIRGAIEKIMRDQYALHHRIAMPTLEANIPRTVSTQAKINEPTVYRRVIQSAKLREKPLKIARETQGMLEETHKEERPLSKIKDTANLHLDYNETEVKAMIEAKLSPEIREKALKKFNNIASLASYKKLLSERWEASA